MTGEGRERRRITASGAVDAAAAAAVLPAPIGRQRADEVMLDVIQRAIAAIQALLAMTDDRSKKTRGTFLVCRDTHADLSSVGCVYLSPVLLCVAI